MARPFYCWLITDTHWNSNFKLRPELSELKLQSNCRQLVAKQDVLIHLGDVIDERVSELKSILTHLLPKCKSKILIKGNHDKKPDNWYLSKGFNLVCDKLVLDDILLSHIPQPKVVGTRLNIHGHFHDNSLERCFEFDPYIKEYYDPNYHRLLSIENTDYKPVRLDQFGV